MLELLLSLQIQTSRVCLPDHPCNIYSAEVDCEKYPRSCFPDDLVGTGYKGEDDRGSGRIFKLGLEGMH